MSRDAQTQHATDGVDPHRYYDAREFCRRLAISRALARSLIAAAREAGCIPNGPSVIAIGTQLLELCHQIGDEAEKKSQRQKRPKTTKSDQKRPAPEAS